MTFSVALVGHKGRMGALFETYFRKAHIPIRGYDCGDMERLISELQQHDVIFIATPIETVVPLIQQLRTHLTTNQLLVDITSVKEAPCRAMESLPCEALGLHPLFGPSIESPNHYPIAVCPIKDGPLCQTFTTFLAHLGFQLLPTTPETHDKIMAYVQCLPHFLSMSLTHFLKEAPFSKDELLTFAPPFFKLLFYNMIRIFAQSGTLYTDIQKNNPYFEHILSLSLTNMEDMKDSFNKGTHEYQALFLELQSFVGETVSDTKKITDDFINQINNI